MPGIVQIVSTISDSVVAGLAAAGYPALVDGKILLGREHVAEQGAPPRIIFIPTRSTFGPRDPASAANVATNSSAYSPERLAQVRQRSVATEFVTFEVRCWGAFNLAAPDPAADYDVTQALYQQVVISTHLLTEGVYKLEGGTWSDETLIDVAGREFVFAITLATPVLDTLLPLAPSNTRVVPTTNMIPLGGTQPETGCSG